MTQETQTVASSETLTPVVERGERGEVGTGTPAKTLKQQWHQAHFSSDKKGQKKRVWVRKGGSPSLKQFARNLAKQGDLVAKEWLENKLGAKNTKRSDANEKAAVEAASKSRAARRKSNSGGKK